MSSPPTLPFTIPHGVDAQFPDQAKLDHGDLQIISYAAMGWSWMTGAAAHAQATPNLTARVDAGVVQFGQDVVTVPQADVTLTPNSTNPRFVLIGVDRITVVSHARAGNVVTVILDFDPVAQGWRVGETIIFESSNNSGFNGTFTIATLNAGTKAVTWAQTGSDVSTTGEVGSVVHVGAWHGTPTPGTGGALTAKAPYPPFPPLGMVCLAAVYLHAGEASVQAANIVDKRHPSGGLVNEVDAMQFPYYAKNDGVTYDGAKVLAAATDAQARGIPLRLQPGAGFLMTNAGVNAQIRPDFKGTTVRSGFFKVLGGGKMQSRLIYTAPFALNTSIDTTTGFASGDPGGRIPAFAVEAGNTSKDLGGLWWDGVDIIGPTPKTDIKQGEDRTAGFAMRMSRDNVVMNCIITGFHSALVYRHSCDHNVVWNVEAFGNWYGCYHSWTSVDPKGNAAGGDHVHWNVQLAGNACASWASDISARVFDAKVESGHWGTSAYGWYRELGPIGDQALPGTATYAREATHGVVTIDTKTAAGVTPWPGQTIGPAFGFKVGDPIDLTALATSEGITFGLTDNLGVVTAVTGPGVLTISMGSYDVTTAGARGSDARTGAAIATTTIAAATTILHATADPRWLDAVEMSDTTLEGCAVADVFDASCASTITTVAGYWQFHGLEPIGRNTGTSRSLTPIAVSTASRRFTSSIAGGTELVPVDGDLYTVTMTVPTGHGIEVGNAVFYDANPDQTAGAAASTATRTGTRTAAKQLTVTTRFGSGTDVGLAIGTILSGPGVPAGTRVTACSGSGLVLTLDTDITSPGGTTFTFLDDRAPAPKWRYNTSRARGKWIVTAVTATTVAYQQVYNHHNAELTGTAANPYVVTGGGVGRMAAVYCGEVDRTMGMLLSAQHEGQSGPALAELHWVIRTITDCDIYMTEGQCPQLFSPPGFNGYNASDPENSVFRTGAGEFAVHHTPEAVFAGAALEATDKFEARLHRGGMTLGIAAYSALANDFVLVNQHGPTAPKPAKYIGFRSAVSLTSGTIVVPDLANPGYVKAATGAGENVIGRCRANSAGTGPYTTIGRVKIAGVA